MRPCVWIVEDDPVCADFLCQTLAALGRLRVLPDASALRAALLEPAPALVLLDDRIGPHRGDTLLGWMGEAWQPRPPTLLLSAELPAELAAARCAQGAAACLAKPMTAAALWQHIADLVPHLLPPWDPVSARRALGPDEALVQRLRALLLNDLPGQRQRVHAAVARGDTAALREVLHRLRAACGFCGALALQAAARDLARQPDAERLQRFDAACSALLDPSTPA
ncbi:MAG: transcriptional regulator [Lysobacteraceae bacterium]|nr:MAG: transcriptional regulator [Xanthomonadaceae bacterium]